MDLASLYGMIDPEMENAMRSPHQAVGRCIVTGMGKKDGRHLALVTMAVLTDGPLAGDGRGDGENCGVQQYAARWIPDISSKKARPDLVGMGAAASIREANWQSD